MKKISNPRSQPVGYTLIELIVVLCVISIFAMLAVPAYHSLLKRADDDLVATQLMRAIQLTRNMALTQGVNTLLCGSGDQQHCSGDWSKGYLIILNGEVQFTFTHVSKNSHLFWRSFPRHTKYLEFSPSGVTDFQNGTFVYCPAHHRKPAWFVVVNQSGRARWVRVGEFDVATDSGEMKC